MKRISLFSAFLFLVFSAWGQLNIVGVNVEKPVSKIAYLEKPIIVDNYFTKYDGLGPWSERNLPTGNTFYHQKKPTKKTGFEAKYRDTHGEYSEANRSTLIGMLQEAICDDIDGAIRFQNDTICVGLPSGYYKIVGMILYWEELDSILVRLNRAKEILILSETETFVSASEVHGTNIKAFELEHKDDQVMAWNEYGKHITKPLVPLTAEQINKEVRSCWLKISTELEKSLVPYRANAQTKKYVQEKLLDQYCPPPLVYVLEDVNGLTYYSNCWINGIMVDYYNSIVAELKGEKVFFRNVVLMMGDEEVKMYDYYTNTRIPISCAQCERSIACSDEIDELDYALKTSNSYKEYTCKDVVVDGLEILAVIDDNEGSSFSVPLPRAWTPYHWTSSLFSFDYKYFSLNGRVSLHSVNRYNELCRNASKAKSVIKKELLAEQQKAEQKKLAEKISYNADIILRYGKDFGNKILNHQLAFGMTPEMCTESIGYPSRYYRSKTESGEVLIYKYIFMTLYFRDNKLVQVDDSM